MKKQWISFSRYKKWTFILWAKSQYGVLCNANKWNTAVHIVAEVLHVNYCKLVQSL